MVNSAEVDDGLVRSSAEPTVRPDLVRPVAMKRGRDA
ncbi:MAG: hypothetical protein QOI25_1088, partial [Mycobacterium sp.]|nr:hypothetical protein [Mycobacterium sp.]